MDLSYLLLLQDFREATNNILTPFFWTVSEFVLTVFPFLAIALYYWVFDRNGGGWLIVSGGISYWLNGMLKLTACVYRPWIREPRIVPAGEAKLTATGYSFPSGHSTKAAIAYGGAGILCLKKRKRLIGILCFIPMLLTMFSRNYLGVHTPQDVIVGAGSTLLMMILNLRFFAWMQEGDSKRDRQVLLAVLIVTVISIIYISVKSYPLDYVDGELLVDPKKMKPDTYKGIFVMLCAFVGWFIEKRWIRFENPDHKILGVFAALVAAIPLYFITRFFGSVAGTYIGSIPAKMLKDGVPFLYVFTVGPLVMKLIKTMERGK